MKLLLSWLIISLVSCAPKAFDADSSHPGPMPMGFVQDERKPRDPNDLRELLISLPVFDLPPELIRPRVYQEAKLSTHEISFAGDGAQSSLTLTRLNPPNQFRLAIEGEGDEPDLLVLMQRQPSGWKVHSRKSQEKTF